MAGRKVTEPDTAACAAYDGLQGVHTVRLTDLHGSVAAAVAGACCWLVTGAGGQALAAGSVLPTSIAALICDALQPWTAEHDIW
jgi:hypothetical protein